MAVFDANVFDLGVFDASAAVVTPTPPQLIPVAFGAASRMRPPVLPQRNVRVAGGLILCTVSLISGTATATQSAKVARRFIVRRLEVISGGISISAQTSPAAVVKRCTLTAGQASGFDAIQHDNEFLLLVA